MRRYEKPVMQVEKFDLNETIATCPTKTTYSAITVDCDIKSGSETIFYNDGTGICKFYATENNTITIPEGTTYGGYKLEAGTYLYWTGPTNGQPSGYGNALMDYFKSKGLGGQNFHAGIISYPDLVKIQNSSL